MNRKLRFSTLLIVFPGCPFLSSAALSQADATDAGASAAIINAVSPMLARVEFHLRYDKGEEPQSAGWTYRCASCGEYHSYSGETFITEERPAAQSGFILTPTVIVTQDPMLHSRFVKGITVRYGDETVEATPVRYAVDQNALFLELAAPLAGAKAMSFDTSAAGPYFTVSYEPGDAAWTVTVSPLAGKVAQREDGERFYPAPTASLIVTKAGAPVGMTFIEEVPADESWKGSPLEWPALSKSDLDAVVYQTERLAGSGVVRVHLSLRSPKQQAGADMWRAEQAPTVWDGPGLLFDDDRVLVLAPLPPDVTARLERIEIYQADGTHATAEFEGSLKDFGAFVARTTEPLSGMVTLEDRDVLDYRNELLIEAEVRIAGETRSGYVSRTRIPSFERGWKGEVYPQIGVSEYGVPFLFNRDGRVTALPIVRRQKVAVESRWGSDWPTVTPAAVLAEVLANVEDHLDPSNIPLSEAEENRLAWLGVELQPMDQELARLNDVADETRDGEIGAIVMYVYGNSPASQAGLEMGDILLRLHVEDQPRPVDVSLYGEGFGWFDQFPWAEYDEIPDQYFDQIPTPWPSVANEFHKTLTKLGFGTEYELEYVRGGEKNRLPFTVVQSPNYYLSAAKYENESLGLTVKDLTFEVRRYFQIEEGDPGIVIARIEPGSKASIAGLKPYEIITHVGDDPITSVAEFEEALAPGGEMRLNVRRMHRGRIVKIQVPPSEADDADDEGGE